MSLKCVLIKHGCYSTPVQRRSPNLAFRCVLLKTELEADIRYGSTFCAADAVESAAETDAHPEYI